MHRLLVDTAELGKDVPALSHEAANHLKVLRPKDGEEIELFDGCGRWRIYRCRELGAKSYELRAEESSKTFNFQPSTFHLTLFACITKGSRWDWTIEKATELGVTRIVPVISERTIVRIPQDERDAKRKRWIRISEDAARQSDAKWLPEILEPVDFADSLALVRETGCFVGALTNPPPKTIGEVLQVGGDFQTPRNHESTAQCVGLQLRAAEDVRPYQVAVFVGPEGDFTPVELDALLKVATPVSFGSTILRAETAAIYGVSVLKSYLDARSPQSV